MGELLNFYEPPQPYLQSGIIPTLTKWLWELNQVLKERQKQAILICPHAVRVLFIPSYLVFLILPSILLFLFSFLYFFLLPLSAFHLMFGWNSQDPGLQANNTSCCMYRVSVLQPLLFHRKLRDLLPTLDTKAASEGHQGRSKILQHTACYNALGVLNSFLQAAVPGATTNLFFLNPITYTLLLTLSSICSCVS